MAGDGALAERVGLATGMLQGTGQVHPSLQLTGKQGGSVEQGRHGGRRGIWTERGEEIHIGELILWIQSRLLKKKSSNHDRQVVFRVVQKFFSRVQKFFSRGNHPRLQL